MLKGKTVGIVGMILPGMGSTGTGSPGMGRGTGVPLKPPMQLKRRAMMKAHKIGANNFFFMISSLLKVMSYELRVRGGGYDNRYLEI
jgi:hypothetical protein